MAARTSLGSTIYQPAQTQAGKSLIRFIRAKMPAPPPTPLLNGKQAYRRWAHVYDTEQNPLLRLEERYLEILLPDLAGRAVLDLGCGTGRWLERFASQNTKNLVGVDSSPEMIAIARKRMGERATLICSDWETFEQPAGSVDIVVCSFVLSYVADPEGLAFRIHDILRTGGLIFVTDLHPRTVSSLGWRRGFKQDGVFHEVATHNYALERIVSAFGKAGFHESERIEPCFGDPERATFDQAGMSRSFQAAQGRPAIYLLQFAALHPGVSESRQSSLVSSVREARLAVGPAESVAAELSISNERIILGSRKNTKGVLHGGNKGASIDLDGFLILPGLVNAHDHLEFALFPRLGRGGYRNSVEWAEDIQEFYRSTIETQRAVPKKVRLWWGGIRNVLCGVTTVCHHNPYEAGVFDDDFIVRVLRDFGWTHSLAFDSDAVRRALATPEDQPFILHLAEGIDEQSSAELAKLWNAQVLTDRTVLVHGLGLDDAGLALLRSVHASLIWCPTSNTFLFGRTLASTTINAFTSVALGNDSPLTASGDLLDEIRFAHEVLGMNADSLYRMTTLEAARILRLRNGEGRLDTGSRADFIAVRDTGASPAERLLSLSWRDVQLVVIGGRVQLASPEILHHLPTSISCGLHPLSVEDQTRWLRAPIPSLWEQTQIHLGVGVRMNGRKLSHE
jgi:cytosine/adenosine deaminase-related metal-dependent hydrolase/ubiquinone/menaquinone biosynthesis C-methylase UbiE